jgi:hypothetical protein
MRVAKFQTPNNGSGICWGEVSPVKLPPTNPELSEDRRSRTAESFPRETLVKTLARKGIAPAAQTRALQAARAPTTKPSFTAETFR